MATPARIVWAAQGRRDAAFVIYDGGRYAIPAGTVKTWVEKKFGPKGMTLVKEPTPADLRVPLRRGLPNLPNAAKAGETRTPPAPPPPAAAKGSTKGPCPSCDEARNRELAARRKPSAPAPAQTSGNSGAYPTAFPGGVSDLTGKLSARGGSIQLPGFSLRWGARALMEQHPVLFIGGGVVLVLLAIHVFKKWR